MLESGAWTVGVLRGAAATRAAIRDRFADTQLFHYAGHAEFEGADGWDSALPLARGRLAIGDIVTAARVPDWVVLSGCETGRAAETAPATGMGLSQAFLTAGARRVVATTRPVRDETARALSTGLYRRLVDHRDAAAFDASFDVAFGAAQLALRGRGDWAAFRLFAP